MAIITPTAAKTVRMGFNPSKIEAVDRIKVDGSGNVVAVGL